MWPQGVVGCTTGWRAVSSNPCPRTRQNTKIWENRPTFELTLICASPDRWLLSSRGINPTYWLDQIEMTICWMCYVMERRGGMLPVVDYRLHITILLLIFFIFDGSIFDVWDCPNYIPISFLATKKNIFHEELSNTK